MGFIEVYSILVPTLTIIALLYAGIEDILYREVRREFIWLVMIGVGLVLNVLYLIFYEGTRAFTDVLSEMLLSIVLGFVIGFVLFFVGAWGGADSKALWSLCILTPIHPFLESNPFNFLPENPILIIDSSVISLLLNSGLIAVFYPIVLMIINAISSTRGSLFDEVRGSTPDKIKSFFFGYKKKVETINPKKLHYDFLEVLPPKEFKGIFTGDFQGKLDGTFVGIFSGELLGEFNGKITGKILESLDEPLESLDLDKIILEAEKLTERLAITKNEDEEDLDYILRRYQEDYSLTDKQVKRNDDTEQILINNGRYYGPIKGIFKGTLDGVFDGTVDGCMLGKLSGDFHGTSTNGKISGTKKETSDDWQLKIRAGLDEDQIMEKRQLRTLWQLQVRQKKTVWVTPGLPFVFLLLLGYILYLFFGDIALFLFRL